MNNLRFIKIFAKQLNYNLRIFFYKAIIVFILAIIFFKLTIGDKINKIDDLILKIDKQIDKIQNLTTNFNSLDIQNKLKENLSPMDWINEYYTDVVLPYNYSKIVHDLNSLKKIIFQTDLNIMLKTHY